MFSVAERTGREIAPIPKGAIINRAAAAMAKIHQPLQTLLPIRNSRLIFIPHPYQVRVLTGRRAHRQMNPVSQDSAARH